MNELKSLFRGEESLPYTFWGWYITPLCLALFGIVIWFWGTAWAGYGEATFFQWVCYYAGMGSFILIPFVLVGSGYAVIRSALNSETWVVWRISAIIIVVGQLLFVLRSGMLFYFLQFFQ